MEICNLQQLLRQNSYPGRGIVMGRSEDGAYAVAAYFIMGRSVNSRNRVFTTQHEGIVTEAADPAKLEDPSLVIYAPVKVFGSHTIVTNGNQTDTVYDFLKTGRTFEEALRTRTFEPDAPNYTPRISGVLKVCDGALQYRMSILKSEGNNQGEQCLRYFYEYAHPAPGEGRFLHTYRCDGEPIPSFDGEPERVAIQGDIDQFTKMMWESLDEQNKVSLFVRYIELQSGNYDTRICNKYQKL